MNSGPVNTTTPRPGVPLRLAAGTVLLMLASLMGARAAIAQPDSTSIRDTTLTPDSTLAFPTDTVGTPTAPSLPSASPPIPMAVEGDPPIEGWLRTRCSDRIRLPLAQPRDTSTVGRSAWVLLRERLRRAGFDSYGAYGLGDSGFAVVCPVEHIEKNGKRREPVWGWERARRGWRDWLTSVFVPQTDRYRVLLLLVPGAPVDADSLAPDSSYVERLRTLGRLRLSSERATRLPPEPECELYVYEFYRRNETASPVFVPTSSIGARRHAERSGLWGKEELP
jgi:hypothetical protein